MPPVLSEGFGAVYHKAFLERRLMTARPLMASIVLLAHRMGVCDGEGLTAAVNSRDPAALHALSCRATEAIGDRLDGIMLAICGDNVLSPLAIGFQSVNGQPVLAVEGHGCEGVEIPVRAMPDGLGRLVHGCLSAINGIGMSMSLDDFEDISYHMGMMAEAYRSFSAYREKNAKHDFSQWCMLEADGDLAELMYHYEDFEAICTELGLYFDDCDKKPAWMKCPPCLDDVRVGYGEWKGLDSQNADNPWCLFIEKTLEVVPGCRERLSLAGGPCPVEDAEDCMPVGYARILLMGNHGEWDMAQGLYEDMMNSEEPMAEFMSLLPVAIPRAHARIEAVAAAEGLLNLAAGISNSINPEGDS